MKNCIKRDSPFLCNLAFAVEIGAGADGDFEFAVCFAGGDGDVRDGARLISVPGGWSGDLPIAYALNPLEKLDLVCTAESLVPIGAHRLRHRQIAADFGRGRRCEPDRALVAHGFARHLVTVLRVHGDLDVDDNTRLCAQYDKLGVFQAFFRIGGWASAHDLGGCIVFAEQPAVDVELMRDGARDERVGRVLRATRPWHAVAAMRSGACSPLAASAFHRQSRLP